MLSLSWLSWGGGRSKEEKEGSRGSERERRRRGCRRREPRAGFLVGRRASGNRGGREMPEGDLGCQFMLQGLNKIRQEH